MAALVLTLLLLAMTGCSSATYCVCKDGVGDQLLQKAIDYACGTGADCTPILQNGACYNPNTVKNHCDYAVNSYFQRKGEVNGSCDFAGTATTSATVPSQTSGCVYPATSQVGTITGTPTSTGSPTTSTGTTTTGTNTTSSTTPVYSASGPTSTTGTGFYPNYATTPIQGASSILSLILIVHCFSALMLQWAY